MVGMWAFLIYIYTTFKGYGNKWWAIASVPINLLFASFLQTIIVAAFPIMRFNNG